MNNIKAIRERLEITQVVLAEGIGCTQGNIGHYEQGQTVPPDAARRLIAFAKIKGVDLTFDDVYGQPDPIQTEPDRRKADLESAGTDGLRLVDRRVATDKVA